MFTKTRLKLTAWYLLIIMAVSILLSTLIYQLQISEIKRLEHAWKMRAEERIEPYHDQLKPPGGPGFNFDLDPQILEEAKERLVWSLLEINLLILFTSGLLGYFLAGKTLKPIQTMLDEQNRFVSDASHELRTPLTSLKSAFEVYLRNPKPTLKKSEILVEESLLEVNKLQILADSLLTLAQYKKPNGKIAPVTIALDELINQVLAQLKPQLQKSKLKVKTQSQPLKVKGHPDQLNQLLVILLDNAIKYSTVDSRQISITTSSYDHVAVIEVADQGVGIASQDLPFIFDRFYRADASRSKSNTGGYGLGLAIAWQIVKHHHGSIAATSLPGKGTTFKITLPLA